MLERLAAWFLNTYVADYVGNVVTDQLSIGVLKGAVELEKLPLKKDAFKKLKLPIDVKSGYIGKLRLQIPPVRYIKSQPWVVQVDQLYIIIGPSQPEEYNADEEELQNQLKKQVKLDKLEKQWKTEQQKSSSSWWSPFSLSFPSNVLANIQVVVNDVHIRYEDCDVDPVHPFALGLMLESMAVQSTDEFWDAKFVTGGDKARKLFDLQNISVYFDTELLGDIEGQDLVDAMMLKHSSVISQQDPMMGSRLSDMPPLADFLIRPVSGQAKLTKNSSKTPLRISDGPRFLIEAQLEEIPICLSDKQYHEFIKFSEAFSLRVKAQKFRRWRPLAPLKDSPGAWWKFALECVLHRVREKSMRYSKTFALKRARQNVDYVAAYTQHLTQTSVPSEMEELLSEVEKEQSYEELAVLRKLAMDVVKTEQNLVEAARKRIEHESAEQSQGAGILQRWFPGWMSGQQTTSPGEQAEEEETDGTSAEEDELLDELRFEAKDNQFARDRILLSVSFSLSGGSFTLVAAPKSDNADEAFLGPESLVEFSFNSLKFSADLRPRLHYALFDLSLGSLTVRDHSDEESLFPVLVQAKGGQDGAMKAPLFQRQYTVLDPLDSSNSSALFGLRFVQEEINFQKHYQLHVQSKPLDIVYNPSTIARVKQFFAAPLSSKASMYQLQQELQSQTTEELKHRFEGILEGNGKAGSHRVSVKLDISAPHVILPEDFKSKDTSLVIVDLGHVTFGDVSDWSKDDGSSFEVGAEEAWEEDDDDIFQTPPSSPPSPEDETDAISLSSPVQSLELRTALHTAAAAPTLKRPRKDPYDRYLLRLSELQIMVGKVDARWREAVRSGQSELHLLDKFTLSVQLQRLRRSIAESSEPKLTLAANLPSLRFHIDEKKVQTVISCLRAMKPPSLNTVPPQTSEELNGSTPDITASMYHSAYSPESFGGAEMGTVGASMYVSALEDTVESTSTKDGVPSSKASGGNLLTQSVIIGKAALDREASIKEKFHRRLLFAGEKLLSAQLSIDEVLLSISSKGRVITELNVPGINFEFLKRPYDTAVRLLVQDLCLVDRIQTFGPEYELVVCSSGRSILGLSPAKVSSFNHHRTSSCPSFANLSTGLKSASVGGLPLPPPTAAKHSPVSHLESISTDVFDTSGEENGALLMLAYTLVTPSSPQHPAVKDLDGDEESLSVAHLEKEPTIQKINIQCTAVDTIANQETVVELVTFFQRALPSDVFSSTNDEATVSPAQGNTVQKAEAKGQVQTEVKLRFERLGIRMLRRLHTRRRVSAKGTDTLPMSRLIAKIMLYGVAAQGRFSSEVAIEGRLDGIEVTDLTQVGKKYSDILLMGSGKEEQEEAPKSEALSVESQSQCLSFTLHRSDSQSCSSFVGPLSQHQHRDVHISAFVPSIHYTHSVNFVQELEIFISEFHFHLNTVTTSFKSAAVGVAKGLVSDRSQIVQSLEKLTTSFGTLPTARSSFTLDEGDAKDETDFGLLPHANDRIYFDISVQSPVIVLPSSLHKEDCLIAHLGEISIKNEFLQQADIATLEASVSSLLSNPDIDRMVLEINHVSLHATRDEESRHLLVEAKPGSSVAQSGRSFKVLKETSLVVQVDRYLRGVVLSSPSEGDSSVSDHQDSDVVISAKICNPLLLRLSKEVFDQMKSTLKYGIRKELPKKRKTSAKEAHKTAEGKGSVTAMKSVRFDPQVQLHSETQSDAIPRIAASFSLPKLSLELKHTIDGKERNLVYISFDDFALQFKNSDLHFYSFDLSLKSIVIEDLLQREDSEYRYILASSSKPIPFMSPIPSPSKSLQSLTGLNPSLSRQLYRISQLMSTPKSVRTTPSPLRSFNTFERVEVDPIVDDRSSFSENETGSTLNDGPSNVSGLQDLLTIKAFYVSQDCAEFKSKYNSVSGHATVDFSSVHVVINLQTWVLLFDYLGIGIPTPPPSRSTTPTNEEETYSPPQVPQSRSDFAPQQQTPPPSSAAGRGLAPLTTSAQVDQSLLEGVLDLFSISSSEGNTQSLYTSARQDLPSSEEPMDTVQQPGTSAEKEGTGNEDCLKLEEEEEPEKTSKGFDEAGKSSVWGVEGKISMEVGINVNSLTVTFNKPEHPLARGTVSSLAAKLTLERGNVRISGSLGQASVVDLTESGAYYRERFATTGEQALRFEIFKYGRPDPQMEREFDISARVRMTSVRYLHTMRFLKEIIAFLSHFPQLIDAFQRMKAMAQGNLVYHGPERKTRFSLDVDAVGPVLLIPKHAFSPDIMVGDIGHIRVTNSTRYDGEEGTLSHMKKKEQDLEQSQSYRLAPPSSSGVRYPTLSPQASVQSQLTTVSVDDSLSTQPSLYPGSIGSPFSLYSSSASPWSFRQSGWQTNTDNSIFRGYQTSAIEEDKRRIEQQLEARKGPCLLDCIELDLTGVDVYSAKKERLEGGGYRIVRQPGIVLKEKGAAKIFIERNLHEDFCRDVPDIHIEGTLEAIHMLLDKKQLDLIKGLLDMNLGEGIEEFEKPSSVIRDPIAQPVAAEVWASLLFKMQFIGVQLEFLQSRETDMPGSLTQSLARFHIQQSDFSFESCSNQTKTVDFTCHSVIGYDTRYENYDVSAKPSVFGEVLRPRTNPTLSSKKTLQVEIHVSLSPSEIKASILLNKLRLMGMFDVILELKSFVFDKLPDDEDEECATEVDVPLSNLKRQLATRLSPRQPPEENKPPRNIIVKLSVTETDFVVVEDMTCLHSNAVVLKGTLILKFSSIPNMEKTLHCSIDGLELFSCSLANEDETALSILDPVSVTIDLKPPDSHRMSPLMFKKPSPSPVYAQSLEFEIQQLNFRLSYNDIKLFLAIAQSLPTLDNGNQERTERLVKDKTVDDALVKKLLPLGFTKAAIRRELSQNGGDLDAAALKLLEQQSLSEELGGDGGFEEMEGVEEQAVKLKDGKSEEIAEEKTFTIGSIEVRIGSLSVCLIDDCVNRDVPLLDISLSSLEAEHSLVVQKRGRARAILSGDYYNRNISAWEPVIEPYNFQARWGKVQKFSTDLDNNIRPDRMYLKFSSQEQLCINVTSSLIHILKATQASWRQDFQQGSSSSTSQSEDSTFKFPTHRRTASGRLLASEGTASEPSAAITRVERTLALLHSVRFVSQTRQRTRFVPFLLRNSTGLPLQFTTLTSAPSQVYVSPSALYLKTKGSTRGGGVVSKLGTTSEWVEVGPGKEKPFDFNRKGKMRHRDTRAVIVHQLLVKVAGWHSIDIPVSVDKIGIFFREVWPSTDLEYDKLPGLTRDRGPVHLVFAISLSDTQKVVNVRSALVLHNTTEIPLEIKLEPPTSDSPMVDETSPFGANRQTASNDGPVSLPVLPQKSYAAVPLHLTAWSVRVRPQGWGVQFCSKHLAWKHVVSKTPTSHTRVCDAIGGGQEPPFRFCVSVQRDNFPLDPSPHHPHPAHTLTLHPPLTVANLLPCDIQFYLSNKSGVRKIIKRGQEITVYSVDSLKPIEFMTAVEGFIGCHGCVVSHDKVGFPLSMVMEDAAGRQLRLTVTSEVLGGTALKISISCDYWLINKTGLPLVFRQEGMAYEASGQLEEHEKATTTTPLLFSYTEGELVEKCTLRIGKEYRYLQDGQPIWCSPFSMISDTVVRRVFVRSRGGKPDQEYQIGVDIHRGRRQYRNTRVVTFVARYQLENRTQYKLSYLQRHQLQDEEGLSARKKIPTILPRAFIVFHWPRADLDKLLSIRVEDIHDCNWSGGFELDKDHSFHVNMRSSFGHSVFVRCEVSLKGATFRVVFSDAASYPPPFRLENLSQISVTYFQAGVTKPSLLTCLNPGQSVPYAWDEATYPQKLCLQVKGSQETHEFDLDKFGLQAKLYYESYFYIAADSTFSKDNCAAVLFRETAASMHQRRHEKHCELVLGVPQGTAVIFQRKNAEDRSQLWRMTQSRQLVHISSSSQNGTKMVLDIAGGRLPTRGNFVPLILQKSSSSRSETQTWRFTDHDDGRLLLDNTQHLCVQSRSGFGPIQEGIDAVLGHVAQGEGQHTLEQSISRMKHSPGSGVLSVSVVSDGPTRTLKITDENKKYTHTSPRDDWVVVDHGLMAPSRSSDVDSYQDSSREMEDEDLPTVEIELSLVLEQGIGVSLINHVPEELLFVTLRGIRVEFITSSAHQCLNATIQHLQVDNKLANSHNPVMVYPSSPLSGEVECNYPILHVYAEKVPHKSPFAIVFKELNIKVRELTILLEERLLFKLLQWAGVGHSPQQGPTDRDEIRNMLTQRTVTPSTSDEVTRQIYFDQLRISETELRVSMHTTSQLPDDLTKIKQHLGFPLVKFESPITLEGFVQCHVLGTPGVYSDALVKHYKGVLKNQAIKIGLSVDFLGNPVGLLTDVASGVSGMLSAQPDVVGLVRDVAHGMSDTTSKLTGTVSHMFGQATFDSSFQEEREQLLESAQSSSEHFQAGLIGLTSGVFGGVTSLITQPYKGALEYGVGGFLAGVGKGIIGTVAKPVAGLFDFASGTTAALRETTSRVSRQHPPPVRHRRCCVGASGALVPYSMSQARGQEYLMRLNDGEPSEKLVSYELLYENSPKDRMKVIISSQYLYFFRESPPEPSSIDARFSLDDLAECRPAQAKSSVPTVYIVLSLVEKEGSTYKAPKYKCMDDNRSTKIAQLINYAKNLHEEEKHVVRTLRLQQGTIW